MIRALTRALVEACNLAAATMQRRQPAPAYEEFLRIPFHDRERVYALEHGVYGTVHHRHELDPTRHECEDLYVVVTDAGQVLVVPEGGLRNAR